MHVSPVRSRSPDKIVGKRAALRLQAVDGSGSVYVIERVGDPQPAAPGWLHTTMAPVLVRVGVGSGVFFGQEGGEEGGGVGARKQTYSTGQTCKRP